MKRTKHAIKANVCKKWLDGPTEMYESLTCMACMYRLEELSQLFSTSSDDDDDDAGNGNFSVNGKANRENIREYQMERDTPRAGVSAFLEPRGRNGGACITQRSRIHIATSDHIANHTRRSPPSPNSHSTLDTRPSSTTMFTLPAPTLPQLPQHNLRQTRNRRRTRQQRHKRHVDAPTGKKVSTKLCREHGIQAKTHEGIVESELRGRQHDDGAELMGECRLDGVRQLHAAREGVVDLRGQGVG